MLERRWSRLFAQPRPVRFALAALILLLVCVGVTHLCVLGGEGRPTLLDDEGAYLPQAQRLAERHRTSLLPGTLPFQHRPPLAAVTFAALIEHDEGGLEAALTTIRKFHVALFLIVLGVLYASALLLGYGPLLALAPPLLLALSTYFWIYVHTAHSEILHAVFSALALLFLLQYFRAKKLRYLVFAGLVLGFSLLVRGSLQPFALALIPWLLAEAYFRRAANEPPRTRLAQGALAGLVLSGGLLLALGPQLVRNASHGHGFSVSSNTWRNIEFGVRRRSPLHDPNDALSWRQANRLYASGGRTPVAREAAAKKRTLHYIREKGVPNVVWRQLAKSFRRFLFPGGTLAESAEMTERFSSTGRGLLAAQRWPARVVWYLVLAAGFIGAFSGLRRGPAERLLGLFVAAYLAGFLLVPQLRLLVPLLPALCLAAPAALRLLPVAARRRFGFELTG